jgi:hypothetical protein
MILSRTLNLPFGRFPAGLALQAQPVLPGTILLNALGGKN